MFIKQSSPRVFVLFWAVVLTGCSGGGPQAQLDEKGYAFHQDAFLKAAADGDLEAVELFLEAGMDPAATNDQGANALMYSAKGGHSKILSLLMDKGVDVDQEDNQGRTALDYCSADPQMASFQLLIQARARYGKLGGEGGHPEEEGQDQEH